MKKMFSIGFLALLGLPFALNGAEAGHYRPLSVMVNKPIGEEVIMDETTVESSEKMEAAQEENLEKSASEPATVPMENETFDGVLESCGCDTLCCEETRPCCFTRSRRWTRRNWCRMMMRCRCVPAPITEINSGCGCGN